MRSLLGLMALALAAGCASEPDTATKGAAAAPAGAASAVTVAAGPRPQICTREYPTGSTIPKTVCREELSADEQAATRAQLQQLIRPGISAPPGN